MSKPIEELFRNKAHSTEVVNWLNENAQYLQCPFFVRIENFMQQAEQPIFIDECFQFVEFIKSLGYEPTSDNFKADPQDTGESS